MDELLQRWEFSKDDQEKLKVLSANLLSHIEEGLTDTPELRGKIVAAYIIHLYREKNPHFLHAEQIIDKFKSIYPRAATSKPSKRYVNVEDVMYKHIFEKYRNSEAAEKGVPATHLVVQDAEWSEEDEKMWQAAVRRKNESSGTWWTFCCTRGYSELTNERGEDAANGEGMELEVVQVREEEPEQGRSEENQPRGWVKERFI